MKIIKGLAIFIIMVSFGSCFDPPEFPATPEIDFRDIEFYDGASTDSLVLYITFKDGDGDLGLSDAQIDSPYHATNYFLEDGQGNLIPVATEKRYSNLPPFVKITNQKGKLATVRTRKKPAYSTLPAYTRPAFCTHYEFDSVYVSNEDKHIFDETTHKVHKVLKNQTQPDVYVLLDTFYYQVNQDHYNIEVDFLVGDGTGFREFDWRTELCSSMSNQGQTFDGRFPPLSETSSGLDGTLRYSMNSVGFVPLFSVKRLKLRVQIKDRALNKSRMIESDEFTLDKIKRN